MTSKEAFIKKLESASENEALLADFLQSDLIKNEGLTLNTFFEEYEKYFASLKNVTDKRKLSDLFWQVVNTNLPLIEMNAEGSVQVYFLYRKQAENGNDLYIQGDYHGYGCTEDSRKLSRIGTTDIMCCITPIEKMYENALITYHFVEIPQEDHLRQLKDLHDKKNWSPDPYAKHTKAFERDESQFCANADNDISSWRFSAARDWPSFTDVENDSRLTHWVQKPNGQIVSGPSSFTNDLRAIQVYKPASGVKNIAILNDGFAILFCEGMNHLQAFAEKEQCALVFISPLLGLGTEHSLGVRGIEYHSKIDQYCAFILQALLPELNKQGVLPNPHPTNMTVIGASISGTAALTMGLTHPKQFSQVIAYSPSPTGREMIDQIPDASSRAREMQIYIECGCFENPQHAYANDNISYARELANLFKIDLHIGLHGHVYEAWMMDLKNTLPLIYQKQQAVEQKPTDDSSHIIRTAKP